MIRRLGLYHAQGAQKPPTTFTLKIITMISFPFFETHTLPNALQISLASNSESLLPLSHIYDLPM